MNRLAWWTVLVISAQVSVGCQQSSPPVSGNLACAPSASPSSPDKVEAKGLHNVYRITDRLFSGSSPEGDDGFRSLQELGIRTIISVDGARPDVDRAKKYGLRYVHLPFGYDGIPRQRVLELTRAVRDLPGPAYLHCHHGKHRGPAAAAAIHLCLDEKCSIGRALAEMRRAGTDPHYTGLYAVPLALVRPTRDEFNRIPTEFPEVAKVPDLAKFMVEIDARWDNLKLIRAAGWKTPATHPDLDAPHEALQLVEHYREAGRLQRGREGPQELHRWLVTAEKEAADLERLLRPRKDGVNRQAADEAFRKAGASCIQCHVKYRDVPQDR